MILNRGGALSEEYFVAYMKLIMNAKSCPANEAKEITFKRLFRNNPETLGKESYQRFLMASESLVK
ncbi:hypothetical protein [Ornithinibacillus contaminans]|uniref:hypothetical protein n=1 Tax=Ornithinibacillus contaminans TaxID=694055 RepID=UPI00064DE888|nr:hypothetical protein [Ornithinibacillus contaminans]